MTELTAAEEAEFAQQNEFADAFVDELFDSTPDDVDVIGVAYGIWVNLTQILAGAGWTGDELARDVHHHAALGSTEGGMQ